LGLLLLLLVVTMAARRPRSNDSVSRLLRGIEQAKNLHSPSEADPAVRREERRRRRLLLLAGSGASNSTAGYPSSSASVSRLLRGIEQANNLPSPSEADPATRSQRRRLPGRWFGGYGISSAASVKHDFRALWRHLAAGWGREDIYNSEGKMTGKKRTSDEYKKYMSLSKPYMTQENVEAARIKNGVNDKWWNNFKNGQTKNFKTTVGDIDGKTDLARLKVRISQHADYKSGNMAGILTDILGAVNNLREICKNDLSRRRRLSGGKGQTWKGTASTKTLKNYLRAIHAFLFHNIDIGDPNDVNIGKSGERSGINFMKTGDKFKNLSKLKFKGDGVLTQIFDAIIETTELVRKVIAKRHEKRPAPQLYQTNMQGPTRNSYTHPPPPPYAPKNAPSPPQYYLQPGDRVEFQSLQGNRDLNGKQGVVTNNISSEDIWVKIDSTGKEGTFKRGNLIDITYRN